jgi:hypothetical protein
MLDKSAWRIFDKIASKKAIKSTVLLVAQTRHSARFCKHNCSSPFAIYCEFTQIGNTFNCAIFAPPPQIAEWIKATLSHDSLCVCLATVLVTYKHLDNTSFCYFPHSSKTRSHNHWWTFVYVTAFASMTKVTQEYVFSSCSNVTTSVPMQTHNRMISSTNDAKGEVFSYFFHSVE